MILRRRFWGVLGFEDSRNLGDLDSRDFCILRFEESAVRFANFALVNLRFAIHDSCDFFVKIHAILSFWIRGFAVLDSLFRRENARFCVFGFDKIRFPPRRFAIFSAHDLLFYKFSC